jgi:hypothetical protein
MRTKSLLLAAASLAAGIATSNAQVYSQNIVGYTSIPVTSGQLTLLGTSLDYDGTGTNNTVANVFTSPLIGDTIYGFNGSSYDVINYTIVTSGHGSTATHATNWFNGLTPDPTYPINPGRGYFYSPAAGETNVEVGNVLQGSALTNAFFPPANTFGLVSSVAPISGGITAALGYNPSIGDQLLTFGGGQYTVYAYTIVTTGHGSTATHATNWYNGLTPIQPTIAVGQGFWIDPVNNTNWTENLVVNP